MLFLRHALGLLADLLAYAIANRDPRFPALVLLLLLLAVLVVAGQAATPLLYALF
jgi:hypothetical protein